MKYGDATMGQTEAVINRMGGFENWLRFAGGQGKVVFETILTFFDTVRIMAQPAVVTSKEYFEEAGVVISDEYFESQFYGLEVPATEEVELAVHNLNQDSVDMPILAELGDKAEISVSQFCTFLAANRKSNDWLLFYLRGKDGDLRAVYAYQYENKGWSVNAVSVTTTDGVWTIGYKLVSHN